MPIAGRQLRYSRILPAVSHFCIRRRVLHSALHSALPRLAHSTVAGVDGSDGAKGERGAVGKAGTPGLDGKDGAAAQAD